MLSRLSALSLVLLLGATAQAPIVQALAPADERAILHVLNRLTYGPRPGDVERVTAMGLQQWIDLQLAPSRLDNSAVEARLKRLETLTLDSATIQREYAGPAMAERRKRQLENPDAVPVDPAMPSDPAMPRGPINEVQRKARRVVADVEEAKLLRAVYSERQLEEVLVDFWFNHFNVFAGKGATRNYITEYERDAIRPHVLGSFRDIV